MTKHMNLNFAYNLRKVDFYAPDMLWEWIWKKFSQIRNPDPWNTFYQIHISLTDYNEIRYSITFS